MSLELIYTSAVKGLKPGSRGFCTVAMTQGMPPQLVDRLEALSGYRQVFAPQDPQAALNPVVCSHLRISVAGRNYHVLSRVCAAGLDYSQRTNKFAHHVVLDANELPAAGPAWLLAVPGFMATAWDQATRLLPPRPRPPAGNAAPAVCQRWQQATGDAGWGGVLIDAAIKNPKGLATLIFKPGQDPLPLLAESLALLPIEMRWQATFSTYYTKLPPGVECRWRCVVEGSPEAKTAAGVVINLCHRLGQPPAGEYVTAARTGRVPTTKGPPRLIPADAPDDSELAKLLIDPTAPPVSAAIQTSAEPTDWPGSLQLPPMLPADMTAGDPAATFLRLREPETAQWPYVVGLLAIALVMVVGAVAAWKAIGGSLSTDLKPTTKSTAQTREGGGTQDRDAESAAPAAKQTADKAAADAKAFEDAGKAAAAEATRKREEDDRAAARKRADDERAAKLAQEAAKNKDAIERNIAEKKARTALLEAGAKAIDELHDPLSLPQLGQTSPTMVAPLLIPSGMDCKLRFFGADTLPKGVSFSTASTADKSQPEERVSLKVPHSVEVSIGAFHATGGVLQFQWDSNAEQSREKAEQILNSALEISMLSGGTVVRSRLFSMRAPAIGAEPFEFRKVITNENGERLECKVLAPPDTGTVLNVEFVGREGFTPVVSETDGSRFQIGDELQFDVHSELSSQGVGVRVRYLGVRIPWSLPDGDPLAKQLQPPDKFTRIRAETVGKFVEDFKKRQGAIDRTIEKTKSAIESRKKERSDAKGNDRQKLDDELAGLQKDLERLGKVSERSNEDLTDAKNIQSKLVALELESERCGYRVYLTVHCGTEERKIYLVTVGANSDVVARKQSE